MNTLKDAFINTLKGKRIWCPFLSICGIIIKVEIDKAAHSLIINYIDITESIKEIKMSFVVFFKQTKITDESITIKQRHC